MKHAWIQGLKPVVLMVLVQIAFASVNVMNEVAINDGMSVRVVIAYCLIFGAASSLSLALIFERKNRQPLTWRVLLMSFFCGLFGGSLFQNLFFNAVALISATFASAIYNLVPAITFILAILCGLEKLNMRTPAGKVKVLGTILGIGGSMLLTFIKGAEINIWTFHINLLHQNQNIHTGTPNADSKRKSIGVLCGVGSCFSTSLWLIIQAKMSKEYPRHHSSTALMTLMGAIQSTVFALCVEKDWSQWKLGWSFRLLTAAYSGIVANGLMYIVIAWCVRMKGPLFASVFNPLNLILVAIASSFLLDENLYIGSVIGGVLIVCGLYMVLWGKSKEMKKVSSDNTQEFETTEIVVMSTTIDPDNCDYSENSRTNCKNNIVVTEVTDESSKSGHQSNGIDNDRIEENIDGIGFATSGFPQKFEELGV